MPRVSEAGQDQGKQRKTQLRRHLKKKEDAKLALKSVQKFVSGLNKSCWCGGH